MEHQSYYRILNGGENNFGLTDRYLVINCTGLCKMDRPFQTRNPFGRNDYYLQYCLEGSLSVFSNGRERILSPGDLLIQAPRSPYVVQNRSENVSYYWLHFTGNEASALLNRCGLECGKVYSPGRGERIVRLFRDLFREFLWRDCCFEDSCVSCLIAVLTEFQRMILSGSQRNEASVDQIFRSLSFFHNHIDQPLTVTKLAEIEHLSPSRYRAVFRHCMGMSPSDYMMRIRMRRACELLAMADLSVREVAEACGYPDQLYFSRVFRAHVGVAPSKYNGPEI